MTDSVSAFLADRLSELDATRLGDLASFAGVDLKVARRARTGEIVTASDCIRLLAALGYDPMTRKRIDPLRVGRFDHDMLRLFLVVQMQERGHSYRAAAKAMGARVSAINNMRSARPVSIDNVIRACAYLGIHPFEKCERVPESEAA